ncbi:pyridoxine biosynthesis protein [Coemansia sp. RSA 485]|nr:pyridoxine biosynthesis protein [Coemansia sp. RSA 485]
MPALSPTMTEGGIARWEKKEGEAFAAGDLLVQIETDKAQMDVEAQDDGILVKILTPEGTQGVKVNSPIAIIAEDGDDISSIDVGALSKAPEVKKSDDSVPPAPAPVAAKTVDAVSSEAHEDRSASGVLAPAAAFAVHANHISNVGEIKGSGPKGRVLKGDVLRFLKEGKAVISKPATSEPAVASSAAAAAVPAKPAKKSPAPVVSADSETAFLVQSLESSVLRHIAALELAKKTTTVQVSADKLVKLIKANKALSDSAFAIRAAALALHQVPLAKDANTRVGVAVEGSRAPTVVEIANASTTGVLDLATAIKEAKKSGAAASDMPAVVLASDGLYTPATLPVNSTVLVVGKPHQVVSAGDAAAELDGALDQLIGVPTKKAQVPVKSTSAVDVKVISDSPAAAAFAAKIKAFLSNPELLTF